MTSKDFSGILGQLGAGETVSPHLMEALYMELRAMAESLMRREQDEHSLQPTALVHEAFLRLVDAERAGATGHLHFLDLAAVTMRRVLVDYARATRAQKRGAAESRQRVTLRAVLEEGPEEEVDVTALDEALTELGQFDRRHARVVELRFFGGMSGEQIASHLGVSRGTVRRDLAFSRAWLQRRLKA